MSFNIHVQLNFRWQPGHPPRQLTKNAWLMLAGDLRTIFANAMPGHATWWWLDPTGRRYNKLRPPTQPYTRTQVTIAIPH